MKNTEINNIYFRNNGASALYCGSALIWKKGSEEFKGVLRGKFTDESTEENWWIYRWGNSLAQNKTDISTFVNKKTKEFEYNETWTNYSFIFLNNEFIEEIYEIPVKESNNLSYMFAGCSSLKSINCSNWNVANVETMHNMFAGCSSLNNLNLENWDVSNVTTIYGMFDRCSSLKSINCSNWNVANVEQMASMFNDCQNLTTIIGPINNIKASIDLNSTRVLTNDSAMVLINGLSDEIEDTRTIIFTSSTYDTLTPEQIALATAKGWSVVRGTN